MIPTHPMHSPTRRRRGRTNIDPLLRRPVWRPPQRRPSEQLPDIDDPAIDITPDIIRIIGLQLRRVKYVSCQNPLPETGRVALHLSLYRLRHIFRRSIRHMTIGPRRMPPLRRPRRIENARLCQQHKRPVRMPAGCRRRFRGGDLFQRIADMDGARLATARCSERDTLCQRPVDLEDPHPITISLQLPSVQRRPAMAA